MTKPAYRIAACDGKAAYDSRDLAERVAKRGRRFGKAESLRAYRCESCGKWHVGGGSGKGRSP